MGARGSSSFQIIFACALGIFKKSESGAVDSLVLPGLVFGCVSAVF